MKNDFLLGPNDLNEPSQPFQKASRIIMAIIVIFFVILIGGFIYYYCLTVELAVLEVDKAATDLLERIDKNIEKLEERQMIYEWQMREQNREFRKSQGR